ILSSSIVLAVVLFLCLVPVPISRIRGVGLVQPIPDAFDSVFVRYPGRLEELRVQPGDKVRKDQVLAVFSNRELDAELDAARAEHDNAQLHRQDLEKQIREATSATERDKLILEKHDTESKGKKAASKVADLEGMQDQVLKLRAPRDGVVGV